jgi:hypothetical protein
MVRAVQTQQMSVAVFHIGHFFGRQHQLLRSKVKGVVSAGHFNGSGRYLRVNKGDCPQYDELHCWRSTSVCEALQTLNATRGTFSFSTAKDDCCLADYTLNQSNRQECRR